MSNLKRARRAGAGPATRGFGMAEAVLAVFITGVLLASALSAVGAAARSRQTTADRADVVPTYVPTQFPDGAPKRA